jgi:hypothetical protein
VHNGAPLCHHHNLWKTRGYTITRNPTGTRGPTGQWTTHRTDGTPIGWHTSSHTGHTH